MFPRHRELIKKLSSWNRFRFFTRLYWLKLGESLNDFIDWQADLPYLMRRRAFAWSQRIFFSAHWVGHK